MAKFTVNEGWRDNDSLNLLENASNDLLELGIIDADTHQDIKESIQECR